jgi:ankyrin repeat protein
MDFVDGDSHLHVAVKQNQLEYVREILTNQIIDVNVLNAKQETPLSIACVLRRNDTIELLVAFGANPFIDDFDAYDFDIQDLLNKILFQYDHWLKGPTLTSGDTPLHTAVRLGRLEDIQKMLDQELVIDHVNASHETPLHLACALGHKLIVHLLVSSGADMYAKDFHNNAPIHRAVSQGHVDIVELLIDFLCNPMIKGYQGRSLLHFACGIGNIEFINKLIHSFNINPHLTDAVHQIPLHIAASHGHKEVVRLLITKHNSPVDYNNNCFKLTPLHLACYCGHSCIIKELVIEHKADLNSRDKGCATPLFKAAVGSHLNIVRELIVEFDCSVKDKGFEGRSLVHLACQNGNSELLLMLIDEFNLDPLTTDDSGNTPLHIACWYGCEELVKLLITNYNCPIDIKNIKQQVPLLFACGGGHLNIVQMLVYEYKADLTACDRVNSGPLHIAALNRNMVIVEALITEFECSPYTRGVNNRTILHYACGGGSVKLVDFLISSVNLDPLCVDNDENTPLHIAAIFNWEEIVRLLIIKYKCPVNCINKYGQTPLHLAVAKCHLYLCTALLSEFGADANALDKEHRSPLNIAINSGNAKVVHILAMEFGCKPYIEGIESKPLLHQLCAGGFTKLLQELIFYFNHDPASVDSDGNTLLHIASLYGCYDIVKFLITTYGNNSFHPINHKNLHGQTPLHCACIGGHEQVAELLVVNNSMINARDEYDDTPLKNAHVYGNTHVLSTILRVLGYKSLKINSTLLYQVCKEGSLDLVEVLLSDFDMDPYLVIDKDGNTPLHIAAAFGHKSIVLLLMRCGCHIDSINFRGQSPLHVICQSTSVNPVNSLKLVNSLISEFKADVNKRDYSGDQPIHKSAQAGYTDIITTLVFDYGCDPLSRGTCSTTLLHQALAAGHLSTAKTLIDILHLSIHSKDCDGNTPLHLSSLLRQEDSVKLLLYDYNAPIFVRNNAGQTASDLATENLKLIFKTYTSKKHKIIQDEYKKLLSLSSQKYAGQHKVTRVFVLGNPGSGKSTLVESLKRKGIFFSFFQVQEADVPLHTAGIVPSIHQSKEAGYLLYFDFAGDAEYYSSHSAILEMVSQSSVGHSVYVIVANVTNSNDALYKELGYWLSFISYHAKASNSQDKLKVIILLSHSDLLTPIESASKLKNMTRYFNNLPDQLNEWNLNIVDMISSNCRKPRSSMAVIESILQVSNSVSPHTLSTEAGLLYGAIEKDFGNVIACKYQTLLKHIKATGICLPTEAYLLYPVLKELQDIGLLMIIGRSEHEITNHLVLIDISTLTNKVHKKLFSESAKKKLSNISQYTKMGIFPESILSSYLELPDYITKECLVQLQYCQKFSHADVGLDYSVTRNTQINDVLLYFPALCQLETEHANWPHDPNLDFSIGWFTKCIGNLDYFPPRFLHVLLLRLTFMFALPGSTTPMSDLDLSIDLQDQNCHCTMWKKGIHWLMREGVECIVELVNENKGVVIIVKSRKQHIYQCIRMLTQIVDVVTEAKTEFCNSVSLRRYILNSNDPSSYSNEDKLYDVNLIKSAIENKDEVVRSANGHQTLTLENLKFIKHHTCWGECSIIML